MFWEKDAMRTFLSHDSGPWSQFFKYAVAGGTATAVHVTLFFMLGWRLLPCLQPDDIIVRFLNVTPAAVPDARRALNAAIATALAFGIANAVAYILNVMFVFKRGRHQWLVEIGLFYLVSGISVVIGTALQSVLIARYDVMTSIAFGANIMASLFINFGVRKYFIFHST